MYLSPWISPSPPGKSAIFLACACPFLGGAGGGLFWGPLPWFRKLRWMCYALGKYTGWEWYEWLFWWWWWGGGWGGEWWEIWAMWEIYRNMINMRNMMRRSKMRRTMVQVIMIYALTKLPFVGFEEKSWTKLNGSCIYIWWRKKQTVGSLEFRLRRQNTQTAE